MKSKDPSLTPNSNNSTSGSYNTDYQPVRLSSASLQQVDTIHKKSVTEVNRIPAHGDIKGETTYKHDDLIIKVAETLKFDENADKLHNYALIHFVQTNETDTYISLSQFMKLFGLSDRKNARHKLIKSIDSLVGIKISRNNFDKLSAHNKNYEPFSIETIVYIDGTYGKYGRGIASLSLNPKLAKVLKKTARPMIYPKKLFQLHGTAYYVLNALVYNKQVNYRSSTGRQDRIKLRTLLHKCPNLPTWETVKNTNRNYSNRIILPLKKAIETDLADEITCVFLSPNGTQPKDHIDDLPVEDFLDSMLIVRKWKDLNTKQLDQIKRSKNTKRN